MVEQDAAKSEAIAWKQVTKWSLVKASLPLTKNYLEEILHT